MSPKDLTALLTFVPVFIERMWSGRRLESTFHKKLPPQKRIAESWEIVDRPEAQSIVAGGPLHGKTLHELWTQRRKEIFGDAPTLHVFRCSSKFLMRTRNYPYRCIRLKIFLPRFFGAPVRIRRAAACEGDS
jgi:hypothetical protein